jgi:hypothetical protein
MATHEILTLQLGGYANFVGAHFWNFQVRLAARRRPPASRRGASLCGAGRLRRPHAAAGHAPYGLYRAGRLVCAQHRAWCWRLSEARCGGCRTSCWGGHRARTMRPRVLRSSTPTCCSARGRPRRWAPPSGVGSRCLWAAGGADTVAHARMGRMVDVATWALCLTARRNPKPAALSLTLSLNTHTQPHAHRTRGCRERLQLK